MTKICYTDKNFSVAHETVISQANDILEDMQSQGYTLTLRQLYYQFVSQDLIPNDMRSYKRLGSIVNDARLAGRISWTAIEDRDRAVANTFWNEGTPAEMLKSVADNYGIDLWEGQPAYVEVWIEKKALVGVIQSTCWELDVPYFACKGYVSQSSAWEAAQRFLKAEAEGKDCIVLHLGDTILQALI